MTNTAFNPDTLARLIEFGVLGVMCAFLCWLVVWLFGQIVKLLKQHSEERKEWYAQQERKDSKVIDALNDIQKSFRDLNK